MTIHDFISKWRKVELKERSAAQEHFIDLCRVFEHLIPTSANPDRNPPFSLDEPGAWTYGLIAIASPP